MNVVCKLTLGVIMMYMLGSIHTYAFGDFKEDYGVFFDQMVSHLPSGRSHSNIVSGTISAQYQTPLLDNANGLIRIGIKAQQDEAQDITEVKGHVSVDMSSESGTNYARASMHSLFIPTSGDAYEASFKLTDMVTNIPEVQEMIDSLDQSTGDLSVYLTGIVKGGSLQRVVPSFEKKINIYQKLKSQPIITPVSPLSGGVYQVVLHKKHFVNAVTSVLELSNIKLTTSQTNTMKKNMHQQLRSMKLGGTFTPATNEIYLSSSKGSSLVQWNINPQLASMVIKTDGSKDQISVSWDTTVVGIQSSGSSTDSTYTAGLLLSDRLIEMGATYYSTQGTGSLSGSFTLYNDDVTLSRIMK